jgi:hypothetical protein
MMTGMGESETSPTVTPPCSVCRRPLSDKAIQRGLTWCKKCRPVDCLGCARSFPKSKLYKLRCPECQATGRRNPYQVAAAKSQRKPPPVRPRDKTPEEKNLARQAAWRRQAREAMRTESDEVKPTPKFRATVFRGGLPGQNRKRR